MTGAAIGAAVRAGRAARGYYRMHRGWLEHELFDGEPYCKRAAWAWLVDHAVWRRSSVATGGAPVTLERGDLSYSLRYMAEAWGWTVGKVRGFLDALDRRGMITRGHLTRIAGRIGRGAAQLVITICNYARFQDPAGARGTKNKRDPAPPSTKKKPRKSTNREAPL